jgi:hypothetical protein
MRYQFHYDRIARREEAKRQRIAERARRLLIANAQPFAPVPRQGEMAVKLTWPPALEAAIHAWMRRPEPPSEARVQGELRKKRNKSVSADRVVADTQSERILSEQEVRRWLRRIRYENRFRKGRDRVPLKVVAEFVGLNRDTLYEAINGGRLSEVTRSRLTWVIEAIEQGRLRFKRRGQSWHLDYKDKPTPPVPLQTISAPFGSTFGGPD